jgi:anhydro-N-acetylmuramic acid kinase
MAFNYLARQRGMDCDQDGETARHGVVNRTLLGRLNRLEYYRRRGAKSLGKEWFEAVFRPCLDDAPLSVADKLRTAVEHVAQQIACAAEESEDKTILVTGGGARNKFLTERIGAFSKWEWVIPDALTVDFKEAIIFAFLGVLRMRGEVNCLSTITGSNTDHCGGAVYLGTTPTGPPA